MTPTIVRSVRFLVLSSLGGIMLSAPDVAAEPAPLPGATNVWSFDDANGTTAVDSVGGNNMSLVNFPAGNARWINGIYGGAIDFLPNQYAITAAPIAAANANQFSVSFWLRNDSNSQSNDPHLFSPQNHQLIVWNAAEHPSAGVSLGNVRDPHGPLVNVWEAYAVTVDRTAATASIYRDGALVASGPANVPLFSTPWVLAHHADLANDNGPVRGAFDDIQFYDRALLPSEVQSLASRPPQPGIAAHLVAQAGDFPGPSPYSVKSTSFFVDIARTDWIGWNRFPELRSVSDSFPGKLFLGVQRPEVDDYFVLKITNPLGQSLEVSMDQNGSLGAPLGQQALIFGTAHNAPDVVRGDNLSSPSYFDEAGAFNSLFTVSGDYTFTFSFRDIFNSGGGYPDVYLLAHTVPEPSTWALALVGATLLMALRQRSVGKLRRR